jgi:peptidylprolyl isomerase
VGLLTYHGVVHVGHFRRLDAEMGDLDGALARTLPGKRLLGLIFDPFSTLVPLGLYAHGHQYYQARIGGMAAWGFVELAHSPVDFRPGAAPPRFPWGWEWNPDRFEWNRWGPSFDYILVRTGPGLDPPWPFRSRIAGRVSSLYNGSRWKLYERLATPAPRPDVDPGPDDLSKRDEIVGAGPEAAVGDLAAIEYTATLMDGTPVLRATGGAANRLSFKLGAGVTLAGIDQGIVGMRVGGKRELILPQGLAYGGNGLEPDVPPGAGLIVHVGLLDVGHP